MGSRSKTTRADLCKAQNGPSGTPVTTKIKCAFGAIIHGIAVMPCSPVVKFHTMLRIDAMPPAADLREAQRRSLRKIPPEILRGAPTDCHS